MSYDDYIKAQKAGKKEYQHHLLQGTYPYLQSLEESISHIDIISEVSLGLQQIPSELIAGTRTAGRRTAFAPNFMPLLDPQSEFAGKWIHLCQSHLEEGIREPVTACELPAWFPAPSAFLLPPSRSFPGADTGNPPPLQELPHPDCPVPFPRRKAKPLFRTVWRLPKTDRHYTALLLQRSRDRVL